MQDLRLDIADDLDPGPVEHEDATLDLSGLQLDLAGQRLQRQLAVDLYGELARRRAAEARDLDRDRYPHRDGRDVPVVERRLVAGLVGDPLVVSGEARPDEAVHLAEDEDGPELVTPDDRLR